MNGGPYQHRYVTEDDPQQHIVCRVCGYRPEAGHEELGCPWYFDIDKLFTSFQKLKLFSHDELRER